MCAFSRPPVLSLNLVSLLAFHVLATTSPTTDSPTTSPTDSPSSSPTDSPGTLNPTTSPQSSAPTINPTSCSPTCGPTTANPSISPSKSPATSEPTHSPLTIAPTTYAPSESPTAVPAQIFHEPDVDGLFWSQVVTNAGEVVWQKFPAGNATGLGPLLFVETPTSVETWTMNNSAVINWRVENVPASYHVKIEMYRDHYHPRHYVQTLIANHPVVNNGASKGFYTWDRVHVDPGYSIDEFYVIRICLVEEAHVCAVSIGVARIEPNVEDPSSTYGGTGLIGTRYEWERANFEKNFDPAEGYWPNSVNDNL
mmetsp:Transcript_23254/g.32455  ORF Transcript_23254/g.32455 Transcript_23254/m.32455 type:complete len:310 (+) Transcript_23254:176-1105(+)